MRPKAGSLRVQRHFEANRLADEVQARAYERLVPVPNPAASARPPQTAEDQRGGRTLSTTAGVAA